MHIEMQCHVCAIYMTSLLRRFSHIKKIILQNLYLQRTMYNKMYNKLELSIISKMYTEM